jgi:SAM-dependent methyltransferase
MTTNERAITLGHPSYIWRAGQERRVALVLRTVPLAGARVLDAGCGLGLYVRRFAELGAQAHGIDIDPDKVRQARLTLPLVREGSAEALPYEDGAFDVVFSNEVLEHVQDDALAVREACRVLRPGGHLVIFAPNRGYPFETHGFYWRGRYHFGNIPLINYLPTRWRNRLCPHVRAYTRAGLRRLLSGCDGQILVSRCVFAGYDNIVAARPWLGRLLRRITYALEQTPLQYLGLSHFVILRKTPSTEATGR